MVSFLVHSHTSFFSTAPQVTTTWRETFYPCSWSPSL